MWCVVQLDAVFGRSVVVVGRFVALLLVFDILMLLLLVEPIPLDYDFDTEYVLVNFAGVIPARYEHALGVWSSFVGNCVMAFLFRLASLSSSKRFLTTMGSRSFADARHILSASASISASVSSPGTLKSSNSSASSTFLGRKLFAQLCSRLVARIDDGSALESI